MQRRPIRIMQVVLGLEIGGLEKVVVDLISNLNNDKYHFSVCCLDHLGSLKNRLEDNGTKTFLVNRKPGIDYLLPFRLAKIFRQEKIQLVHTHNATCYFYGVPATILANIPIVIHTEHGRNFPDKKIIMAINKILSWKVDKIITVCEILRQQLNCYEKINLERMEVVSNGIDSKLFTQNKYNKEIIKKELGFGPEDKLIGIVARLHPIKNHRCLFNAFPFLIKEFPESRLLVIGNGSERQALLQLARELKIDENVFFLGNRKDIPRLLSALDVFVLSSQNEGLSLTLIEAMAASLPIVATKVGGNPEIIRDGVNGLLVPPDDPISLSKAISQLLKDREKAYRMGISGRRLFEEQYTLNKMVKNYERIYEDFISKKLIRKNQRRSQKWSNYVEQPEGKNFVPGKLEGYYNDLTTKALYDGNVKDDIPLIDYGKNIGFQENAIAIAQMALGCYEVWLTKKDESYKERFLKLADWLVEKQKTNVDGRGVWEFKSDWNYRLKSPWISAMAQGEGISVLLRAHQVTQEGRYLTAAQRALKAFNDTVEEGGVKSIDENGNIFFEEYPSIPYSHILNGFIFALWGLYDYAIYQNDSHARKLFDTGVATLEGDLTRYDLGYWSTYDLYKPYKIRYISNSFYHELHIAQLRALYRLTRRDIFLQTAEKWEGYQKNIFCRIRFFIHTIAYKAYCKLFNID